MHDAEKRVGLKSVFVRCAGIAALSTVLVAGTLSVQSNIVISELTTRSVVQEASKTVEASADALAKPIRFKATPKIEETVQGLMTSAGDSGTKVVVLDAEGNLLSDSGEAEAIETELVNMATASLESGEGIIAKDGLWVAQPVFSAPGGAVIGVLAMAWNADAALDAAYWQKLKILATAAIVFGAMMAIALFLFQRVLGRPLAEIGKTVKRISGGDLDSLGGLENRGDEFGRIGRHLAVMTETLKEAARAEDERRLEAENQAKVVGELSTQLSLLSQGNLSASIDEQFPEQYEQLRADFNASVENLGKTISQVVHAAQSIKNGTSEISQASFDLSHRTESQAATLEETAAALDELTASVKSAADGAKKVEETMSDARSDAEQNRKVVEAAVTAMTEIEESSNRISQIIGVIDDIAFQTNLLALNAGVEAARAGDSGKGFAVVASEVRSLAQRSSEAAMEIKTLITDSSKQVERGVDLVGKAGDALGGIVFQVAAISEQISVIAEGSAQQSIGLNEINIGVSQLDQVTQQNAAMVEQATAATQTLSSDTEHLSGLVSKFIVAGLPATAPSSAPEQPSAHGDDGWEDVAQPVPAAQVPVAAASGNTAQNQWQDF